MEPNNHRRHPPEPLHPLPDPTSSPSFIIHIISQRFSKLYANHSKHAANSLLHPDAELHHFTSKPSKIFRKSRSYHETRSSIATPEPQFFSSKVKDALEKPKICRNDSKKGSQFPKLIPKEDEVKEVRRVSVSAFPSPSMLTGGGGRLSLGSSLFELAYFFSSSGCKILAVDMPPFMQIQAVHSARRAHDSLEKFTSKTMALTIKKEFDGVYGTAWHCIVGTSFGSYVTHSVGGFIYFCLDKKLYILLFKTTVQRAAD